MKGLITAARPFLSGISKAKGGKLFRVLLDNFLEIDAAVEEQVATTVECIEWTTQAKRRFLKQALEIVLTRLHLKARQFREALQVISLSLSLSLSPSLIAAHLNIYYTTSEESPIAHVCAFYGFTSGSPS